MKSWTWSILENGYTNQTAEVCSRVFMKLEEERHSKYEIKSKSYNHFIKFLMIEQNFLSPKVKLSMIISKKVVYMSFLTSCQTISDIGS